VIVPDATVWISALLRHDPHHVAGARWLRAWMNAGGTIVAPTLIVPEVAGAVIRRSGRLRLARQAIADLLADPTVRLVDLDARLADNAADLAANLRLRGADAVYVALARREGVPLVTWDQEQLTRAQGVVATHTPDDAPTAP
jgi:predicted nucleic acid-binding protein